MKPLEGITVIELSTYIAASSYGRILTTQGVRVVKVEFPRGDVGRTFDLTLFAFATDEENLIYDILNGGKEALMLDLKKPRDVEIFYEILVKADVFPSSNRPQALKKIGLDHDNLESRYPGLTYAVLLDYGEKEPKTNYPGLDAIAMLATGDFIRDMMMDSDQAYPVYFPMGFEDLICGTTLSGATGIALYAKEKSDKGNHVSLSPYGAAVQLFSVMSTGTQFGCQWPRGQYQGGPMRVPHKTKDSRQIPPMVNEYERHQKDFCLAVGAEEIMEGPRFCTKQATFNPKNREDCVRYFETRFTGKNADETLPKLVDADTIASELGHFKGNHSSEQALVNGYMSSITYPNGNAITPAVPPVKMECMDMPVAQQARPIGADNGAILKEFGVDV